MAHIGEKFALGAVRLLGGLTRQLELAGNLFGVEAQGNGIAVLDRKLPAIADDQCHKRRQNDAEYLRQNTAIDHERQFANSAKRQQIGQQYGAKRIKQKKSVHHFPQQKRAEKRLADRIVARHE